MLFGDLGTVACAEFGPDFKTQAETSTIKSLQIG